MMQAVNSSTPERETTVTATRDDAVRWLQAVAASQDRQAFAELYGLYAPKLKSYMIRQGADAASADDLTQETMVQIWRKAGQYDPLKAAPSSWIFRVARNLRIDRLRRQKFHEVELTAEADQVDGDPSQYDRSSEMPDAERLQRLVRELPRDQLEVIQLAFFEGLSHGEIVQRLSLPLGTVKSRLRLAFGKLRKAMGEVS
jgi:RNA polymerase sigma-70 factor (ECF subfamily)